MNHPEQTLVEKTAQDLQDEIIALHERKNWPDPRHNWLIDSQDGPVSITSLATTGAHPETGERTELAGGMSAMWGQPLGTRVDLGAISINELNLMPKGLAELPDDRRKLVVETRERAYSEQLTRYLEILGGPATAEDLIMMKVQADHYNDRSIKGNIVCADDVPRGETFVQDDRPAFMMYSYDPDRILAIKPADCPVIMFSGKDKQGRSIHGLIHSGWQDEDAGLIKQGMEFLESAGCDAKDLRFHIAPGGVEFGYSRPTDPREGNDSKFTDPGWKKRIDNVHPVDENNPQKGQRFTIDMVGFAVDDLRAAGVDDYQIYIDSTDTSDPGTGYSSHKLASRPVGDPTHREPTRDISIVMTQARAAKLNR